MAFDDIVDSFNARARDSFNTTTTNTANLNVGLENVGNTDASTNDSGNTDVRVDGSFNEDSHDVDIDDSGNTLTDESVNDSYNTAEVSFTDDHSIEVGSREYNTGFGDLSVGALGGDGGFDGRATVVDQSVNQNIDAFGIEQSSDSFAVVASGDGAIAAGDDVDITQSLDDSTTIIGGGDVNVGNETTIENTVGSGNTYEDNSMTTDASQDWDIDESFNDYSDTYEATNSFNDEIAISSENDWDVDANVIWDSEDSAIVGDVDVELPPV
jgi:hypothetical protein